MYLEGYEGRTYDDGLGNFWTKIRDNIIKPVGRVVAGVYTGGASEIAFKAYDAQKAAEQMKKAQKAQMAQLSAMGNAYPPQALPPSMDPGAMRAFAAGMPPNYASPGYPPVGSVAYAPAPAYNAPVMSPSPATSSQLPSWAIPAGVGALVLVVLASRR
jgi:hypothetical protein